MAGHRAALLLVLTSPLLIVSRPVTGADPSKSPVQEQADRLFHRYANL